MALGLYILIRIVKRLNVFTKEYICIEDLFLILTYKHILPFPTPLHTKFEKF